MSLHSLKEMFIKVKHNKQVVKIDDSQNKLIKNTESIENEDIYTNIGTQIDSYVNKDIHSRMHKKYQLTEFFTIIDDIISNDTVKQMKNYRQHCNTSCYKHCMQVAYFTYIACKKLKLDYISATRAAMLHDLFLYDWRKKHRDIDLPGLHAFIHPQIAFKNASKLFELNDIERDIILKHMWPVTFGMPRYRETFIVTVMDKYSACLETYLYLQSKLETKTFYRYAYIFLSMIFFRIA